MIQQMFLLLGLGVFLASCESGTGDKEKITPFSMNSLDSIIVGTDQGIYPVSGTCHEEGTVIAVTVNDTFINNTLAVQPSPSPTCSSKAWSTTVDVSSLNDGTLTVVAVYGEGDFTQEKTVSKDTEAPTVVVSSSDNISPATKNTYGISGTCSENQREVGLTLSDTGGTSLSPPSQTICSSKIWTVSSWNVSSLADGNITLTFSHSDAAGNSTKQTKTIIKSPSDIRVTVGAVSAINISNVAAYSLSGTCIAGASSNNSEAVTVTVGGATPTSAPACTNEIWAATFNLGNVVDGANIAISASYKNAPIATASVLKDVRAPTVALNTPPNVNRMTDSTYTLSGRCSESGRAVRIVARDSESTANEVSAQANCATTQWQKTMDITSLQAGTLNLRVSHSDLAGNEATATGTANNNVIMTLTTPSHIDDDNELSYGVSGTCSEEGEDITLSVGSVSPSTAPTCASFTWEVTGLDVSGLDDGAVTITAAHKSVTQTASIYKGCTPGGGDGASAANPIIICGYDDLNNIRNALDTSGDITKHYALGLDIDASSSWSAHSSEATCTAYNGTDIATSTPCSGFAPLPKLKEVSFDGKGYTISKLYIYAGGDEVGLFSSSNAVIKNLHLKSVRVHNTGTSSSTGGIVGGSLSTIISESSVEGAISGLGKVGGIVGFSLNNGIIKNSYTDVTLTGGKWMGGIVGGLNSSRVFNSYARGSVTRTGTGYGGTGGIAGNLSTRARIRNSYAHVSVSGIHWVGSLTGNVGASSSIHNSYGTGPVGGTSTSKGGIAGSIDTGDDATVTNNFWDTQTTEQTANTAQGTGLITTEMKVVCTGESTTGICALGSAFIFTQGSYPKVKKCESSCDTDSPTFSNDLVIGQE